ncbi:MAG: hypothetical protein MJ250_05040 [Alphaproteobacteria bacterium]|nr:hypothetical protein [Alphaproteobacteria bacterium]
MNFNVKKSLNDKQLCWLVFLILSIYMSITHFPKVETNFSSLLGDNFAISTFFGKNEKSVHALVEGDDFEQALQNSEKFYETLDLDKFSVVRFKFENQEEIMEKIKPHRYGLLSPADRKMLLDGDFDQIRKNAVKKFKNSKEKSSIDFEKDPFYLFDNYKQNLVNPNQIWQMKEGCLTTEYEGKSYILIILRLKNVDMTTINYLREKAKIGHISLSGTPFQDAEITEIYKKQIKIISIVSSLILMFLSLYLFGHIKYLILILSNVVSAFFVGGFSLLLFSKLHMVTFVFATLLIVLSALYPFYYLSTSENQRSQLIKNMFKTFCGTILCFVPLLFIGMPVLKQIATFTMTALATVFLNTIIFCSDIKIQKPAKVFRLPKFSRWVLLIPILFISSLFVKPAVFSTDTNVLYRQNKEDVQAEELFTKVSQIQENKFLVITADYVDQILSVEEQIKDKTKDYYSLSTIVPSKIRQKENVELVKELFEKQLPLLKKNLKIKTEVENPISYPLMAGEVWEFVDDFIYLNDGKFHSVTQVPDEIPYSIYPNKLMQKIIDVYKTKTYKVLAISFVCLLGVLSFLYRKKVLLYIFPSILSLGCLITILSWMNIQITFLHLLSFFIVIGVGIDYSIMNLSHGSTKAELCAFLSNLVCLVMFSFVDFQLISSIGFSLGIGLLLSFVFSLMQYKKKVI